MKVLHLASFNGNIGDNAHHQGFRSGFEAVFGKVDWFQKEIRRFYNSWGLEAFDQKFCDEVNQYDALVIGGGNFFEVCHDYSETGCTINLNKQTIEAIKIPVFFNALGFDIHKGANKENLAKFHSFMKEICERNDFLVTFRNDGSVENYESVYGKLDSNIYKIPDGGFFVESNRSHAIEAQKKTIGINLASDMINLRLLQHTYDEFLNILASVYIKLVKEQGIVLRFFPHILSDYKIISDLLDLFDDHLIKYSVEIMPYLTGQGREQEIFSSYAECEVVTGMRFHTNVCAFGMGIKTVPLVTYPKIKHIFTDIGHDDMLVDVNGIGFELSYFNKLNESVNAHFEIDNSETVSKLRADQLKIIGLFKTIFDKK